MSGPGVLERAAGAFERASARAPEPMRDLLADDVAFLRRLDARLHHRAAHPAVPARAVSAHARNGEHEGRTAAVAVGVALAAGVAIAKAVDWLALTEPRVR